MTSSISNLPASFLRGNSAQHGPDERRLSPPMKWSTSMNLLSSSDNPQSDIPRRFFTLLDKLSISQRGYGSSMYGCCDNLMDISTSDIFEESIELLMYNFLKSFSRLGDLNGHLADRVATVSKSLSEYDQRQKMHLAKLKERRSKMWKNLESMASSVKHCKAKYEKACRDVENMVSTREKSLKRGGPSFMKFKQKLRDGLGLIRLNEASYKDSIEVYNKSKKEVESELSKISQLHETMRKSHIEYIKQTLMQIVEWFLSMLDEARSTFEKLEDETKHARRECSLASSFPDIYTQELDFEKYPSFVIAKEFEVLDQQNGMQKNPASENWVFPTKTRNTQKAGENVSSVVTRRKTLSRIQEYHSRIGRNEVNSPGSNSKAYGTLDLKQSAHELGYARVKRSSSPRNGDELALVVGLVVRVIRIAEDDRVEVELPNGLIGMANESCLEQMSMDDNVRSDFKKQKGSDKKRLFGSECTSILLNSESGLSYLKQGQKATAQPASLPIYEVEEQGEYDSATLSYDASDSEAHESGCDTLDSILVFCPNKPPFDKGVAVYDYSAQDIRDLSILKGDILDILGVDNGKNWYVASLNGRHGLIPCNHVRRFAGLRVKPSNLLKNEVS